MSRLTNIAPLTEEVTTGKKLGKNIKRFTMKVEKGAKRIKMRLGRC